MPLGHLIPGVPSTEHAYACVHTNEIQITNENRDKDGDKDRREPDTRPDLLEHENNDHDDTDDAHERQRAKRTNLRALNRQKYKRHRAKKTNNELESTARPEIQAAAANSTNLRKLNRQKYKRQRANQAKTLI